MLALSPLNQTTDDTLHQLRLSSASWSHADSLTLDRSQVLLSVTHLDLSHNMIYEMRSAFCPLPLVRFNVAHTHLENLFGLEACRRSLLSPCNPSSSLACSMFTIKCCEKPKPEMYHSHTNKLTTACRRTDVSKPYRA